MALNGLLLFGLSGILLSQPVTHLPEFHLPVPEDSGSAYVYSNQLDSYWSGHTHRYHDQSDQGWNYRHQMILRDIFIAIGGQRLPRESAHSVVTPIRLLRSFPEQGVREHLYFLRGRRTLVIELITDTTKSVTVIPAFPRDSVRIEIQSDAVRVIQNRFVTPSGLPLSMFLEITGPGTWQRLDSTVIEAEEVPPAINLPIRWQGTVTDTCRIYITVADDLEHHEAEMDAWSASLAEQVRETTSLANQLRTDNPDVNQAVFWAKYQLQNLLTSLYGRMLLTGIPENGWYSAREALLSIPGGLLVTGDFRVAEQIIRTLAERQITDRSDKDYGRIPRRFLPGFSDYQAADVTPLMTVMLYNYLRYSGDFAFAQEMYPLVYHGIEGALKYRVSGEGLLLHGEADTWMDGMSGDGPTAPRGDRAVEIQVLWYRQLTAGTAIAQELGFEETADRWQQEAKQVRTDFNARFRNLEEAGLFDHLNSDNTPDSSSRPNQIFAVSLADDLVSPEYQGQVVRSVMQQNTYPRGVSTLAHSERNFHPYLSLPPLYTSNQAIYNGVIWPWLSGPVISGLAKFGQINTAYRLTDTLTQQLLHRGMIGSPGKVRAVFTRDLLPERLRPATKVTPNQMQAYGPSLAEYVRTWYQDYLGITPDAFTTELMLSPQLPEEITRVQAQTRMGSRTIAIGYERSESRFSFHLRNDGEPVKIQLQLRQGDTLYTLPRPIQLARTPVPITIHFQYDGKRFTLDDLNLNTTSAVTRFRTSLCEPLEFASPSLDTSLPAFSEPNHPLLSGAQATHQYYTARSIVDVKDATGDDLGPGAVYQYPTHPSFEPGIFDLTGFAVRTDDAYVYFDLYFKNVLPPERPEEFGLPNTFVAVGIHTGDEKGHGQFGYNAEYQVEPESPVQYILYIGNGFRVVNPAGETLVEFIPGTGQYSLIDREENKLHVAIPVEYFPQVKQWWKYTVIVGGRETRGNGEFGAFLPVNNTPCLWYGGGKSDSGAPNWFDLLRVGFE
ncbi:MAG TPA: amylo-alpha-1,6-glucosidase [bacterium]|nr:amylo-alpha-1,6-glucosidase [bacterium]